MDKQVFLDTSFILARLFSTDRHHARAVELDAEIRKASVSIITNRAVCLELGAALSKPELRSFGIRVLKGMEQDPSFCGIHHRVYVCPSPPTSCQPSR